jgi:hypothetical protein
VLRALGLLAALWFAWPLPAALAQEDRERGAWVEQALGLSGTRRQLGALEDVVRARLRETRPRLDGEGPALLDRFLTRALGPDALYALVRGHFREQFDRERLGATLAWLRSPTGRKMTRLEAEALAPGAEDSLREFEASLGARAPSSERFVLVNRLAEATQQPEFSLEMLRALAAGLGTALERAGDGERFQRLGEVEQALTGLLTSPRAAADQAAFIFLLFTYRGARDAELEQYVKFLQSEPGRWFTATWRQAVVQAVDQSAARAGAELLRPARSAAPPTRR